jgi:hypothetical protein
MDRRIQQALRIYQSTNDPRDKQRWIGERTRAGLRTFLGLSLSFCIKDILSGHVDLSEVTEIISSTTGFVENGQPGPNYDEIIDRYMQVYWIDFSRDEIESLLAIILPAITEEMHGLPGAWVDASQPHYWGWVPHGNHLGIVGDYVDPRRNILRYSAEELRRERTEARFVGERVAIRAAELNHEYGFGLI